MPIQIMRADNYPVYNYDLLSHILYNTPLITWHSECSTQTIVEKGSLPFDPNEIVDVAFYPPATKMTFADGKVVVATAQEGDEFDPYIGMIVCICKYIFKGSSFNSVLRKWIKVDEERKLQKEKAEQEKLKKAEAREKKAKKKAAKRLLKQVAKKEEAIEIQKEAYLRAMRELSADKESSQSE